MTDRPKPWTETRDELRTIVFRRGYRAVAAEIPAARSTVYRLVNGEIREPSKALRRCVEQVVERDKPE